MTIDSLWKNGNRHGFFHIHQGKLPRPGTVLANSAKIIYILPLIQSPKVSVPDLSYSL